LLFGSIAESFEGPQKPPDPSRDHSSSTTGGRKEETHHPPLKLDRDETGSDQRRERKAAQWGNECDPTKSNGNPNLAVGISGTEVDAEDSPVVGMWAWVGSGVTPGLQPTQDEREQGTGQAAQDGAPGP
jgi:hypothetical protein